MPSYTVNASTSVVLVDTSVLGPGESAIVYLSTATTPGQIVSVRDSLGYLSSPQAILVSTAGGGTLFADGTSTLLFNQPFASASFSAADANTWNIINTFAFPLNNTVANIRSLAASTLVGQTLNIGGGLSTAAISANTLVAQSSIQVGGPLTAASLYVGGANSPPPLSPGSTLLDGPVTVAGPLTAAGGLSAGGPVVLTDSVSIGGSLTVQGLFTTLNSMSVAGSLTTTGAGTLAAGSVSVTGPFTALGATTFNSNVTVLSTATVQQSTTTTTLVTSNLVLNTAGGGYLQLGSVSGPVLRPRTDILPAQTVAAWNAPVYTPYMSTGTVQAPSTATVGTLIITSSLNAASTTQVQLGSAQIVNPAGSLLISSVATNTLTLSNTLFLQTLQASTVQASSLQVQTLATAGPLTASSMNVGAFSTGQLTVGGQITAGALVTPSVLVSSLYVNQTIDGTGLTSVVIPNASVDNSSGRLLTSTLLANTVVASTVTIASGQITSPSTIQIAASTVLFGPSYFSTLTASSIQTSSLTATRITLGAPIGGGSNGPDFYYDSGAGPSTNVLVSGGPGNYLTPYFLSNVVPTGQNPNNPYTTAITFAADYKGQPVPPGLLIEYSAILYWGGQVNSQLAIGGGPTLFGTALTNTSTTGTLSQSSFSIAATLYGASAIGVNFKFRYTPNANSIDSNTVVQFNNGRLVWNYALNGTTIQNSLNDITTRNLFYYGSLNFASDPRIKEDIQEADLARCYETIANIPLRRFRYSSAYCSAFQVPPTERLGVLATDVQAVFPKSVHVQEDLLPAVANDLMTIDTAQLQMAHLGATKYLMKEVERLEQMLAAIL